MEVSFLKQIKQATFFDFQAGSYDQSLDNVIPAYV